MKSTPTLSLSLSIFTHVCCFVELSRLQCVVEFALVTDDIALSSIWPQTDVFGIVDVADLRPPNC